MHQILAGAELERRGLVTDSFPVANDAECGTVLRQEPTAGAQLRPGEHVRLTVSLGPDPLPDAQVPGLTGLAVPARTAAREFGFTVRTIEQRGPAAKVGLVLRQEPEALSQAPESLRSGCSWAARPRQGRARLPSAAAFTPSPQDR